MGDHFFRAKIAVFISRDGRTVNILAVAEFLDLCRQGLAVSNSNSVYISMATLIWENSYETI